MNIPADAVYALYMASLVSEIFAKIPSNSIFFSPCL